MDLKELDDPEKFIAEEEVELFDAHEQYTKEKLERYAKNSNDRESKGCPSSMTIGHTVDDQLDANGVVVKRAREEDQPRIVGYWRKWSVKWSAKFQAYVLCATPYYKAEDYEEAKKYPKASVELWRHKEIVDPVALLRRTPDRPVQVSFAATGERYRPGQEPRYRYSMETGMDEPEEKTGNPGTDPTGAPSATAPSPEDLQKFSACCQATYPHMKAMHDKFAAEAQAATVAPPALAPAAPAAPPAVPPEPKDKMSALESELAEERRKGAATRERLDIMAKTAMLKERRTALEYKRDVEKYAVDVEKEMKDTENDSAERFAAHLADIPKFYRQDAAAEKPWIDARTPGADKFSAAEEEKANAYYRQHSEELAKIPWEQAWAKARKFAMTGKAD